MPASLHTAHPSADSPHGGCCTTQVLEVVKAAEKRVLERELSGAENKEYLSMDGLPAFNKVTAELLLGAGSAALKEGRVATLQSLSGTGSLRVGAAFIARFMKGRTVYISNPTWGNHYNIFGDEGVPARPWPQSRSLRAAGCSGRIPWAAAAASRGLQRPHPCSTM